MPRRGEYRRDFPGRSVTGAPRLSRVGSRVVTVLDGRDEQRTVVFDPQAFTCSSLAAELSDEWVELCEAAELRHSACYRYRRAIVAFCGFVDDTVPDAAAASLSRARPDLLHAVTEWARTLPSRYPAGSREPAYAGGVVRRLIGRRAQHPDRFVTANFDGWLRGSLGLRRGRTQEVDEFSLADKKRIIAAAWAGLRATEQRLTRGRELAANGADPRVSGWLNPANLLRGLADGLVSPEEIAAQLPHHGWPPVLTEFLGRGPEPSCGKRRLIWRLAWMLYPHNDDLHPFRLLLMAATNRTSEEVAALTRDDVEFRPDGVLVTFRKNRARTISRRSFSAAGGDEVTFHPSTPRLDPAWLLRKLMALSGPLAERAGLCPAPLFLRASANAYQVTIRRFDGNQDRSTFADWLHHNGVTVDGPPDIRRLRKSGKVEKALTFRGRISDIADDHSEQVFRGHYAHGTTLRVISGQVITAAQQRWFTHAVNGPTLLTEQAEASLPAGQAPTQLGLSRTQVEDLRTGALDMGVTSCRDPFDSPYGRSGSLCPVAPLRCLECRNAFVLPSNLPQLLLFAEHLDTLKMRLTPHHFHELWGQSAANLEAALADRTDAEITLARKQIAADGLSLQLPLATRVEFDT
jgi:hypothetical protein